jgi:PAS domain-containing protein
VSWINAAVEEQFGVSLEEVAGRQLKDILPQGEVLREDARGPISIERIVKDVARTGEPVTDIRYRSPTLLDPHRTHVWSCSYVRLHGDDGRPIGVCEASLDITESYVARQRLALLGRASGSIGRSLDIRRTAADLADLVVPEFADGVTVDLLEPVLSGLEPPRSRHGVDTGPPLCRVARHGDGAGAGGGSADTLEAVRIRCLADAAPVIDQTPARSSFP